MSVRELICIGCPLGCNVEVEMNEDGEILSIKGNTCPRGENYARKEVTNPERIVCSTVMVDGGETAMVSVKTADDIPKGKIFECVRELRGVKVKAPVHIGDVIVSGVAGTDVDVVATREVAAL